MPVTEEERASAAAAGGAEKGAFVRQMFSTIAPRYDLLNHLLSLNIDKAWRRKAIRQLGLERSPSGHYLDLCAGTLDVGAALVKTKGFTGSIVGADFAEPMLRAGAGKAAPHRLAPVVADALMLPIGSGLMAGAIVAFGIRNVSNLDDARSEVHRVLEPGAKFVILEFTTPRNRLVRSAYHVYFHHMLPRIGALISGHGSAYKYLPASVAHFPEESELANRMETAGFSDVHWSTLTFGIAAIHVGTKSPDR